MESVNKIQILLRKKWRYRLKKQIEGQLDFLDLLSETHFLENLPQFIECDSCWCYDCKHNENNEAEPRDFGGEKKPCPSCKFCVEQKKPEICQIGSYKNGCKLRAKEEGFGVDT